MRDEDIIENDVICPFCWEGEFDLIGLKIHLLNYCESFAETPLSDKKEDGAQR